MAEAPMQTEEEKKGDNTTEGENKPCNSGVKQEVGESSSTTTSQPTSPRHNTSKTLSDGSPATTTTTTSTDQNDPNKPMNTSMEIINRANLGRRGSSPDFSTPGTNGWKEAENGERKKVCFIIIIILLLLLLVCCVIFLNDFLFLNLKKLVTHSYEHTLTMTRNEQNKWSLIGWIKKEMKLKGSGEENGKAGSVKEKTRSTPAPPSSSHDKPNDKDVPEQTDSEANARKVLVVEKIEVRYCLLTYI